MPRAPGSARVTLPCPFVHPAASSRCWKPRPMVAALGGLRARSWVAVAPIPFVRRAMARSPHHGEGAASQLAPQSPERSSHPCSPPGLGRGCSEPPHHQQVLVWGQCQGCCQCHRAPALSRNRLLPKRRCGCGRKLPPRGSRTPTPPGGLVRCHRGRRAGGGWFAPPGHRGAAAGTYSGNEPVVPSLSPRPRTSAMWRFPLRRRETGKATSPDLSKK